MAVRKRSNYIQKVLIVGITLTLLQIGLLIYFKSEKNSAPYMDTVEDRLQENDSIGARRKAQARIQLAIVDYRSKNQKLPGNLDQLKPEYFDVVPIDPQTGKPFSYRVSGNNFYVGETEPTPAPTAQSGGNSAPAEAFVYDPTGKRDPFRPFEVKPQGVDENKTPLERFDIGQFKLTAVLNLGNEPTANVELSDGKGFLIRKGTKIGVNNGEVVDITTDKVIILENFVDFTGQKTSKTVEMNLRAKEKTSGQGAR
jgi:type IV pilus assembly protein PilP